MPGAPRAAVAVYNLLAILLGLPVHTVPHLAGVHGTNTAGNIGVARRCAEISSDRGVRGRFAARLYAPTGGGVVTGEPGGVPANISRGRLGGLVELSRELAFIVDAVDCGRLGSRVGGACHPVVRKVGARGHGHTQQALGTSRQRHMQKDAKYTIYGVCCSNTLHHTHYTMHASIMRLSNQTCYKRLAFVSH